MGSPAPRVSVIVPVRNRRELLLAALGALGSQTFRDYEIIVVDDCSDDGLTDEAICAAATGACVRVIRLPQPSGAVAARLAGVAASDAEILAFTDSDCRPEPSWLERLVGAIDAGADLVQGRTEPTRPVGPLERSVWGEREDGLYATCNVAYARQAYEAAGGFAPDAAGELRFRAGRQAKGLGFGEDSLLGWRVRRRGRSAFEPEAVVRHHVFPFDARAELSRAWQAGAFPALVLQIPELRRTLLRRHVLLGDRRQAWLLAATALTIARRPAAAAVVAVPWLAHHAKRVPRTDARWPARLAFVLAREVVIESALVAGTVRSRRVVL